MNIKGIIAGGLVALALGAGGYFGYQYRHEISKAFSNSKGEIVKPVVPEDPKGDILPYTFKDGVITNYTGNDEVITLPTSYSPGAITNVLTEGIKSTREFTDFISVESTISYPLTMIDANGREKTFENADECFTFSMNYNEDMSVAHFPVSVKYETQYFYAGDEIKVTGVGERAFYYNYQISQLNVPEGITEIGNEAFTSCGNLAKVSLPSSLKVIGDNAFCACSNLIELVIPENVSSIGSGAFSSCSKLNNIVLPSTIEKISQNLFAGCERLTTINLPNSVKVIEGYAFWNCLNLKSITLPTSFERFEGECVFSMNLEELVLSAEIKSFDLNYFNQPGSVSSIKLKVKCNPENLILPTEAFNETLNIYIKTEYDKDLITADFADFNITVEYLVEEPQL